MRGLEMNQNFNEMAAPTAGTAGTALMGYFVRSPIHSICPSGLIYNHEFSRALAAVYHYILSDAWGQAGGDHGPQAKN
jgi:hypothetical protein